MRCAANVLTVTDTASPAQGYLPGDLYNLNSKYGSEEELIGCVKALQNHGIKVLGDAVSAAGQGPGWVGCLLMGCGRIYL